MVENMLQQLDIKFYHKLKIIKDFWQDLKV